MKRFGKYTVLFLMTMVPLSGSTQTWQLFNQRTTSCGGDVHCYYWTDQAEKAQKKEEEHQEDRRAEEYFRMQDLQLQEQQIQLQQSQVDELQEQNAVLQDQLQEMQDRQQLLEDELAKQSNQKKKPAAAEGETQKEEIEQDQQNQEL